MKPFLSKLSPLSSPVHPEFDQDCVDSSSEATDEKFEDDLSHNGRSPSPLDDDGHSDSSTECGLKSGLWTKESKGPEVPDIVLCHWCKRVCPEKGEENPRGAFPLTNADKHFCSEVCFTQSRRASFKKSKVCDWCHQVKSSVSYVRFVDGKHQLQFCSTSCLNQYKMHIFCRETEAHLQLHPHIGNLRRSQESALITPDLWLRETTTKISCDRDNKALDENGMEIEAIYGNERLTYPLEQHSPLDNDDEPVNLTTSKESFKPLENKRPQSCFQRQSLTQSCDSSNKHVSHQRDKTQTPKITKDNIKGRIKVRQLEERQENLVADNAQSNRVEHSISPLSGAGSLPTSGIPSALRSLLMNGQNPFLSTIPNIISPNPIEFPHPQRSILPQLLLTPEYLKFPGLRPPFIVPPVPQVSPLQPTNPNPLPQSQPNCSTTVLLPCPVPVPIPVPIPIPFPVPVNDFTRLKNKFEKSRQSEDAKGPTITEKHKRDKETMDNFRRSRNHQTQGGVHDSETKEFIALNPTNSTEASKNKIDKNIKENSEILKSVSPTETVESKKIPKRKERRSMLQYTSDVYEINGVFVPKGGTWIGNAAPPVSLSSSTKKSTMKSNDVSYKPIREGKLSQNENSSNQEKLNLGNNVSCKRSPEPTKSGNENQDNPNEPLHKKKHLII